MNMKTKDGYFKETVEQLKEWGFMVYAPKNLFEGYCRYGWVTDGTHLLYFQIDDLEGLLWSTECIPSKETCRGRRLYMTNPLSKEDVLNGFKVSYGKPWRNFEDFKKCHWNVLIQI